MADPAATRAPDLVNRQFHATAPGLLHVADSTYVPLAGGGFGYTAFVIDAYAGLIPGWECSTSEHTGDHAGYQRTDLHTRVRAHLGGHLHMLGDQLFQGDVGGHPLPAGAVLGSRFALRVMDWRDSNIVLGEQMNTRGYDASTLLPSHKGVGILRPDGETDAGADVMAMTVRTYYMPNPQWRQICARGRALRESAGTLAGHAAGDDQPQAIDPASVVKALGADATVETQGWSSDRFSNLPEPLASVVDYLSDDLGPHGREFVPTAELTDGLDIEPTLFARQMGEMGCRPARHYVPTEDGTARRVRGYLTADIRAALDRAATDETGSDTATDTD